MLINRSYYQSLLNKSKRWEAVKQIFEENEYDMQDWDLDMIKRYAEMLIHKGCDGTSWNL